MELRETAKELAENANILNPQMDAKILADRIESEADSVFLDELGRDLRVRYFTRLIRAERREFRLEQQMVLPGCEHLPRTIVGHRRRRIALASATYKDLTEYQKQLNQQAIVSHRESAKSRELRKLISLMARRAKANPGITVAEVLAVVPGR